MSVLKNLKSIFIVEEQKSSADESSDPGAPSAPGIPREMMNESTEPVKQDESASPEKEVSGEKDDKIIDTLFEAIDRNNLGGFDYLEFKRSVNGLEKMVADEATRFKSAFATASTMGVTLDKLVETAGHYLRVLDEERSKFGEAARQQTIHLIDDQKKEMQHLLARMADKQKMIEKLKSELTSSEEKLKEIQTSVDAAGIRIAETKKNFDVSFGFLREQIETDIEKMKSFLK